MKFQLGLAIAAIIVVQVKGQAGCAGACSPDRTRPLCKVVAGCDMTGANASYIAYKSFYYNVAWASCVGTTCPACALQQNLYLTMRQCQNVCDTPNVVYPPQSGAYTGAPLHNYTGTTQQPCGPATTPAPLANPAPGPSPVKASETVMSDSIKYHPEFPVLMLLLSVIIFA